MVDMNRGDLAKSPDEIRKVLTELDRAPDDEARAEIEAKLVPPAAWKPIDPSQEISAAELDALVTPESPGSVERPAYGMGTVVKVQRIARGEVGYHEEGSNCTKYGKWYGHGLHCAEWCDMFVCWVYSKAGALKEIGGKHARADFHCNWFEKHGRFHRRGAKGGGPHAGDLIFFDFNGHDGADHVGLVMSYTSTHVYTVEGNRSNMVKACKYARSDHAIWGYGYPLA